MTDALTPSTHPDVPLLASQGPLPSLSEWAVDEALTSWRQGGWRITSVDGGYVTGQASLLRGIRDTLDLPSSVTSLPALRIALLNLPEWNVVRHDRAPKVLFVVWHPESFRAKHATLWAELEAVLLDAAVALRERGFTFSAITAVKEESVAALQVAPTTSANTP